jgi:acetolactate decarboxylase
MKYEIMSAPGRLKKERFTSRRFLLIALCIALVAGSAFAVNSIKDGLIEYVGAQRDIFKTGKAGSVVSLEDLSGRKGLYAVGPIEGLDGEITIFDSRPYITKVRGSDFVMDNTFKHGAFFLVWTEQTKWKDVPVPEAVKGYVDLQQFVKAKAQEAGIDVTKPFPFLLSGTPAEIKWHINVDRTGGKPITQDLFMKSKQPFVTKNEPVDILGFYAEHHAGVFLPSHKPKFMEGTDAKNVIHIHLVSKTGKAAGHIDNITLGEDMVLRLPEL